MKVIYWNQLSAIDCVITLTTSDGLSCLAH